MAADGTYMPAVHRLQGGNTLEVSTAGTIDNYGTLYNRSGATFSNKGTLSSTGTLSLTAGSLSIGAGATMSQAGTLTNSGTLANTGAITNTGTITNSSDGQIRDSVELKVAAGALTPYGISVVGSSTAGARNYTLVKPPAAGIRKTIICKGSTAACVVRCSSLCTLNYGANRKITFAVNADGFGLDLIATSATNWQAVRFSTAMITTIAFGTT